MEIILHLAVPVSDIDVALTWQGERFDFETVYADESWARLQFANVAHPPHFAVAREDAESHGRLTPHRDGTASVYIRDHWNNAIEIMNPPPGAE